jgi:hypothetical protein
MREAEIRKGCGIGHPKGSISTHTLWAGSTRGAFPSRVFLFSRIVSKVVETLKSEKQTSFA